MSANPQRKLQGRNKTDNNQSQRQGVRNNLPRSNIQQNVQRSQKRIQQIKSPFASDQTKTIANRPTQKKRVVGQIPLRDRQHGKLKVNQKQSSGIGQQVRKLTKTKPKGSGIGQQVRKLAQQKKPIQKQQPKQNQFTRKNKSKDDINKIFDFKQKGSFF